MQAGVHVRMCAPMYVRCDKSINEVGRLDGWTEVNEINNLATSNLPSNLFMVGRIFEKESVMSESKPNKWAWLPVMVPGVVDLMAARRQEVGADWVRYCWQQGVAEAKPGYFWAAQGPIAIGVPGDLEMVKLFRDVQAKHPLSAVVILAPKPEGWVAVFNRLGMAKLCINEVVATSVAADADELYPHNRPHRAAQLDEVKQPLTDEQIAIIAAASGGLASDFLIVVARAIERAHGIGYEGGAA